MLHRVHVKMDVNVLTWVYRNVNMRPFVIFSQQKLFSQ